MTVLPQQVQRTTSWGADIAPPIGVRRVAFTGLASVVDSWVTVWGPATAYPWPTAPVQLEIVSTDPGDNAGGAGARAVTFAILDPQMIRHTVVAPMHPTDGTIAQPIALPTSLAPEAAPLTTNTAWRVMDLRLEGACVGTQYGSNIGDISIRVAGAGAVLGFIPAGYGDGHSAIFTTAANERAHLPAIDLYNSATLSSDLRIASQYGVGKSGPPFEPARIRYEAIKVAQPTHIDRGSAIIIPPLTDLELQAKDGAGGADISIMGVLWIEDVPPVSLS